MNKQQKSLIFELRIKNTKQGQQKAIIGLIFAMVVILFYVQFTGTAKERGQLIIGDQQCIESVRAAAAASVISGISGRTSDFQGRILCPTRDTKIKEDLDTEKGKEKAFEQIALDMARCWKNYGKGKLPLFEQEGVFCGICSWIEFTDKDKKVPGFSDYLVNTDMPLKALQYEGIKGGISFADYLANYEHPQFKKRYNKPDKYYNTTQVAQKDDTILTSGDTPQYAVTFLYFRGEDWWDEFLKMGGATRAGGSIAVGHFGAAGTGMALLLLGIPGIGWAGFGITVIGMGIVGVAATIWSYVSADSPAQAALVTFRPYDREMFESLHCEELISPLGIT